MKFIETEALTFDDVLIAPNYSDVTTRENCDTSTSFLGINLKLPIISSNMDLVTGPEMAKAMWDMGGLGILHRFVNPLEFYDNIESVECYSKDIPVAFSVGTRDLEDSFQKILYVARNIVSSDRNIIVTIDVAHGHHSSVSALIDMIRSTNLNIKIIAGNVATGDGAFFLKEAGADAIKVGIGPGAACTTRVVTGIGVPQLSAIADCADALKYSNIPIIADGGIRSSGDIVKALAAGANVVMLGKMLAGTKECPGEVIIGTDGRRYRRYIGQSVYGVNGYKYTKEGVSGFVEEKGPVSDILRQISGGIRSGMSYVGAKTLSELVENARFIKVSTHTISENNARISEFV